MGLLNEFVKQIEQASDLDRGAFMLRSTNASSSEGHDDEFTQLHSEAIALLYNDFDGQSGQGIQLFGEFRFLPLKKAKKFWDEQCEINCDFEFSVSDERLKDGFSWRRQWFPFGWNQDANSLLMLDFEPSRLGSSGQVFAVMPDLGPGWFAASSFSELVSKRLYQMAAADYKLECGRLPRLFPL